MAVSQNGWPALTAAPTAKLPDWITGRVLPGAVETIFAHLCQEFNKRVEPIRPADSWGWAYRDIRGATTLSNHASGTAIDLNASTHPLGKAGTFNAAQVKAINAILGELDGVVRWGGNYSSRKDEMHFEINAAPTAVEKVATRLKNTQPPPKPIQATPNYGDKMKTVDLNKSVPSGVTMKRIQALLTANGFPTEIDGKNGPGTKNAAAGFQKANKLMPDLIVGPNFWNALLGVE